MQDIAAELSERISCRRFGNLGWEVLDFEHEQPFAVIRLSELRRRARIVLGKKDELVVARKPFTTRVTLSRGNAVVGRARGDRRLRGSRYTIECEERELVLTRAASQWTWDVSCSGASVGVVKVLPFGRGEFDVELPAGSSDVLQVFVATVTILERHNPLASVLSTLGGLVPWPR